MAKIPVRINDKSTKEREVTVVVYVDGQEFTQTTQRVQEWAIPYVATATCVQVEDPDYESAADDRKYNGG